MAGSIEVCILTDQAVYVRCLAFHLNNIIVKPNVCTLYY